MMIKKKVSELMNFLLLFFIVITVNERIIIDNFQLFCYLLLLLLYNSIKSRWEYVTSDAV